MNELSVRSDWSDTEGTSKSNCDSTWGEIIGRGWNCYFLHYRVTSIHHLKAIKGHYFRWISKKRWVLRWYFCFSCLEEIITSTVARARCEGMIGRSALVDLAVDLNVVKTSKWMGGMTKWISCFSLCCLLFFFFSWLPWDDEELWWEVGEVLPERNYIEKWTWFTRKKDEGYCWEDTKDIGTLPLLSRGSASGTAIGIRSSVKRRWEKSLISSSIWAFLCLLQYLKYQSHYYLIFRKIHHCTLSLKLQQHRSPQQQLLRIRQ